MSARAAEMVSSPGGAMNAGLFRRFTRIAYEQAGLAIRDGKEALVTARVSKRQRALGLPSIRSYLRLLEDDDSGQELVHFLDAMSTNFTRFFREREHFAFLRERVATLVAQGQRSFTLWCAAAATGEEPYSIAMSLLDLVALHGLELRILATDISTRALGVAEQGRYDVEALREVPVGARQRYFRRCAGAAGAERRCFQVRDEVRALVTFHRLNLARPPFPMHGPFDVVFCRNVMIYFDQPVRAALVAEIERLLRPGGVVLVGHAEALTSLGTRLAAVRPSIYRRVG